MNQAHKFPKEPKGFANSQKLYLPTEYDKFGKKTFSIFSNQSPELHRVFSGDQSFNYGRKNKEFVTYDQLKVYDVPWAGEKRNSPFSPSRESSSAFKYAGNYIVAPSTKNESLKSNLDKRSDQKELSLDENTSQFRQSIFEEQQNQNEYNSSNEKLKNIEQLIDSHLKTLEQQKQKMIEIKNLEEQLWQKKSKYQNEINRMAQEIEELKSQKSHQGHNYHYESQSSKQSIFSNQAQNTFGRQSYSRAAQAFYGLQEQNQNLDVSKSVQLNSGVQKSLQETRKMKQILPKSGEKINQQSFLPQDYALERVTKSNLKSYQDTKDLII